MKSTTLATEDRERARRITRAAATLLAVLALLLVAGSARAQELSDIPSAFVDVGVGAGPMGMGGAVVASVDGAASVFWNPAGLAAAARPKEFSLTYCDQMGLVPYSAGSGLFRLGDYTLGAGIIYSGDDVLSETTLLVSAATNLAGLPWAPGRPVGVGAAARVRWASFGNNESAGEQVTGSAMGVGLDVGAQVPVTETTTLGITGRDLVNMLNWDSSTGGSYGENVPAALVFGVAMSPHENLVMEVDLDKALRSDNSDVVRAGAGLTLFDVATLRAGYTTALPDGEPEEYSIGAGATVAAGTTDITLDLAYLFGHLDNTLRLSLGVGL